MMSLFNRIKEYFSGPGGEDISEDMLEERIEERIEERRGYIHIYTGDAAGKTSAALGRALRAVGHGHRVVVLQFLKGREDIGEYLISERLGPEYEIHQYGTESFINPDNPSEWDRELARSCLDDVARYLAEEPDVLILDEICYACAYGLIEAQDVVDVLENKPPGTYVILTGRNAPRELLEIADIATELVDLKDRETTAQEGIEY